VFEELLTSFFDEKFSPQILQAYMSIAGIILLCIAAIVFVSIYFWHLKGKWDDSFFTITRNGIGEQSEKIREMLKEMKANKREINSALVLIEELVVRMQGHIEMAVTARVKKFLGDIKITLSSEGEAYNPFLEDESWNGQSEDYLRGMILYANRSKLSYSRRNGKNVVTVLAHAAGSHAMYYTMAAMFLGIAFGFVLKLMPLHVATFISGGLLFTIQTLFMNSLSLLLAPVLFFSIITGFSSLSSNYDIGRIGGKVLGTFLITTLISILLAFFIAHLVFENTVSPLPLAFEKVSESLTQQEPLSVKNLILGIIPNNLIIPISEGNMLQLIFVAIFAGISMLALGDKVSTIRHVFNEANELFLKMMNTVIAVMPLVAFSSMGMMVFSSEASFLLMLIVYLIAFVIGTLVLFLVYSIFILFGARISPLYYIKKAVSYLVTPFMISSSSACIPMTINFCQKKLGVSKKITSFTIPIGATINMNGTGMMVILSVLFLAKITGVSLDLAMCLKLGVLAILVAVGSAGIPNSVLIPLTMLLTVTGIPVAAIGYILGIWNIMDRLVTVANVNGDIAAAVLVARSESELDEEVYRDKKLEKIKESK